ncbi:phosphoribosyl-ATP diphosphatase [Nitrosospira briensis]|uniref:Phosphoribosyl-ATP pyrophosphatase n=1 Tax=Nitrosospira briensis TaxID=35799 RepID=A0A1I4XCD5_9PROT|nr:phosphoribosyl-ATP diphosphatase [Nitrosospira briensis]SFN22919.1 phosphoribosyl-ATP pyrophosphohydrolase [Nitrosospira briensis]SFN96655.1 phosphoribosyl-ATP pyrophosphatase [Nitrosospira briensis]
MTDSAILDRVTETIEVRRSADPSTSYVSKLLHDGQDKILKKVAEESAEVLLASKDGDKTHIVREMADLWFHCLVLLAHHNLGPNDVLDELRRREGMSGLDEKAARKTG